MENPQAVRNEDERAGTKVDLETWKKTVFEKKSADTLSLFAAFCCQSPLSVAGGIGFGLGVT